MRIGIVSEFPHCNSTGRRLSGVATYTQSLVNSLTKLSGCNSIVIFADKGSLPNEYVEDGVKVIRIWTKGIKFPFQIAWAATKHRRNIDVLHVQHEYFLYGGSFSAVMFPLMLLLLGLCRKPIIVTLHGVVPLSRLNRSFMQDNKLQGNPLALKIGMLLVTKVIAKLSDRIIVHHDVFKKTLQEDYEVHGEKIVVVPHGIGTKTLCLDKLEARKRLNLKNRRILLFFGYLSGYKRLDILIEAFSKLDKDKYLLLICGGKPSRLKDSESSRNVERLKKMTAFSENIVWTDFVPEDKINLYFAASDLVIFPYTIAMSSSGPMSIAISYNRPFLVSNNLKEISNVTSEFTFDLYSIDNLVSKIEEFFASKMKQNNAVELVSNLRKRHSWEEVGKKTFLLYQEKLNSSQGL